MISPYGPGYCEYSSCCDEGRCPWLNTSSYKCSRPKPTRDQIIERIKCLENELAEARKDLLNTRK